MKSNITKILGFALVVFTALGVATGCKKDPQTDEHVCKHVCPTCGKCLDESCKDPACAKKCDCNELYTVEQLLDLNTRDVVADNGVVAAANPFAAYCGLKVLAAGGNAFDAAVATSFGLGLCEPHCSGIGGGGIMVGYDAASKEFVSYNFREFVPGKGQLSAYGNANEMDEGIRAAGVPTLVKSLLGILDEHGNFHDNPEDREKVIGPARDYAYKGFTVTPELASGISSTPEAWIHTQNDLPENYAGDPETYDDQAYKIFSDEGIPLDAGEKMVNTNLGKVYDEIINLGSDGFYKGWVADAMIEAQDDYYVSQLQSNGTVTINENKKGLWTKDDFTYVMQNYPKEVRPLNGTYKGYDIVSATCPSSGGIILLEGLNMLEHYCKDDPEALTKLGHNSPEYINLLSTVTQLAYGDKQKYIGDTSKNPATGKPFTDVPVNGLMDKVYAAYRLDENYKEGVQFNGKYSQKKTTATGGTVANQNYGDPWKYCKKGEYSSEVVRAEADPTAIEEEENPSWSTTSFSCADKDGNIVTVTQTINHFFGAKLMPKGCGFFLNNQLSSFTKTSGSASIVAPYKHPTSHIMPTIILKDGEPVATLGSPGSMRLVTAVFTTVVNMLDWGMNIQDAIEAARAYSYCVSSTSDNGEGEGEGTEEHKALFVENYKDITLDTIQALKDMGYALNVYEGKNLFFGGVQGITFENGKMHGGADIRRDGKALGF